MVIQMILSDFRSFILCKLQKHQDFINYVSYQKVKISKYTKNVLDPLN